MRTGSTDSQVLDRRFSVAPMLDWTDRHCRYFLRLLSRRALLYTEMYTTDAMLHGDLPRLLGYNQEEHPLALQVGGSVAEQMGRCARLAEEWGFDEVNINVGCPSDRVQSGRFGACLMAEPERVADCVTAMRENTKLPVTVKSRIGIDHMDSYEEFLWFISTVAAAGCRTFIVHARKAWLQGLSPKQNRDIPPLDYERVYRLKQDFPELEVVINGGINDLDTALRQVAPAPNGEGLDGVMLGREVYHNPYILAQVDRLFYGEDHPLPSRHQVIERFLPYVQAQLDKGVYLSHMTRHILGLFQGVPGAKAWRRWLSEHAHLPEAGVGVIREAAQRVDPDEVGNKGSSE